jgi:uncharacterized protein
MTDAVDVGAETPTPLDVLIRVQDLDTAIAQLQHRRGSLPERAELSAVEAALTALDGRGRELDSQRQELLGRQNALEEQIEGVAGRRRVLEDRLYGARGSAARDLQAMDEEIRHLAQRREELEEQELAVMEEQEPVDVELRGLAEERDRLRSSAETLRRAVADTEAVVDAALSAELPARAELAAGLPKDLADRYESLRSRLGGTGAARLVGNHCDGCHLELPSVEVERVRRLPPGTVATCDQCGRILVRA